MAKGQRKYMQETINQKTFEGLCAIQCTMPEICSVLVVGEDTLRRWCKNTYGVNFETIREEKANGGKASLRRTQFKLAERNSSMAIFLGKQILGQRDTFEIERPDEDVNNDEDLIKAILNRKVEGVDNG